MMRLRRDPVHRPPLPPPGRDRHALCVTVDFETLDDKAVTIRDRDTTDQDRVSIDRLVEYVRDSLAL